MEFSISPKSEELRERLLEFVAERVEPATPVYFEQVRESGDPHFHPPVMEELKQEARKRDLWNLFLPNEKWGAGLSNVDYAPLCEIMGHNLLTAEATNCAAPDTGNMEILAEFGTTEQQEEWLVPLLEGEIRSCFAMTEPWVASSDATNIQSRIERDGDHYVVNAHKWWTSGAASARCKFAILMGVSDPDADPYHRHSMIIVPMDAPGVSVQPIWVWPGLRTNALFLDNVRVPRRNLIGERGMGFYYAAMALNFERLSIGSIGMARRHFRALIAAVKQLEVDGRPLRTVPWVRERLARLQVEIDAARMLGLETAWALDHGRVPAAESSMAKIFVSELSQRIADTGCEILGLNGQLHAEEATALAEGRMQWLYRISPMLAFGGGTNEVQRDIIGFMGYGLPRK
jgi:acyl-CoA dehydrogenase